MEYRLALSKDLPNWLEVAADVGSVMRVPNMPYNLDFITYATRKLMQGNAIMAWDSENMQCVGFIGFSRHNNSITWLGVKQQYQNRGIGSTLLLSALHELDTSQQITVNTYPHDYIPGIPARTLYFKHGFVETGNNSFFVDQLEMVTLTLTPQ